MAEELIIKVLDPDRVEEVIQFLGEHFSRCAECADFFDGEGNFCSPECDLAWQRGQAYQSIHPPTEGG